jgi:hypothetical protein
VFEVDKVMNRISWSFGFPLLLASFAIAQTVATAGGKTTGTPKMSASFVERVIKFLGISDSPSTFKGPGDEVTTGQLWLAELDRGKTRATTAAAGYSSPIFIMGSRDILALKGTEIWLFPAMTPPGRKLYSVESITKLVASSADNPDEILILQKNGASAHPRVSLLSVSTGKVTPERYDPMSSGDLQMIESLQSWERVYGDKRLYVSRETKQAMSGSIEWADVFLKVNGQERRDISQCDGTNCGQPSMSSDGRLVVFVKAESD